MKIVLVLLLPVICSEVAVVLGTSYPPIYDRPRISREACIELGGEVNDARGWVNPQAFECTDSGLLAPTNLVMEFPGEPREGGFRGGYVCCPPPLEATMTRNGCLGRGCDTGHSSCGRPRFRPTHALVPEKDTPLEEWERICCCGVGELENALGLDIVSRGECRARGGAVMAPVDGIAGFWPDPAYNYTCENSGEWPTYYVMHPDTDGEVCCGGRGDMDGDDESSTTNQHHRYPSITAATVLVVLLLVLW